MYATTTYEYMMVGFSREYGIRNPLMLYMTDVHIHGNATSGLVKVIPYSVCGSLKQRRDITSSNRSSRAGGCCSYHGKAARHKGLLVVTDHL